MKPIDETVMRRKVEAEQLRAAWHRRFGKKQGFRAPLAKQYEVTEGFIGLLLNGHSSISTTWKLRMARYLDQHPSDIWPEFDVTVAISELLPPDVASLVHAALQADPERRAAALLLLAPPPSQK